MENVWKLWIITMDKSIFERQIVFKLLERFIFLYIIDSMESLTIQWESERFFDNLNNCIIISTILWESKQFYENSKDSIWTILWEFERFYENQTDFVRI